MKAGWSHLCRAEAAEGADWPAPAVALPSGVALDQPARAAMRPGLCLLPGPVPSMGAHRRPLPRPAPLAPGAQVSAMPVLLSRARASRAQSGTDCNNAPRRPCTGTLPGASRENAPLRREVTA